MIAAFLDTTVLADLTLKDRDRRQATRTALEKCAVREYPQYALKELNAGVLGHYRWVHNVLAEADSFEKALGRIQAVSGTPQKNRTSTAIEALRRAAQDSEHSGNDREMAEGYRLNLKKVIFSAWSAIPRFARMTHPLDCYVFEGPRELEGGLMIVVGSGKCKHKDCALATTLHGQQKDLTQIEAAVVGQGETRENSKRLAAIRRLRAMEQLDDSQCRDLGDAVFALLAPVGSIIVTTNVRHHRPLAEALSKRAALPAEL